jgi:ectoine hydroxylase-related dioxygenase (phytanoyl-CoA dioxygenase family)
MPAEEWARDLDARGFAVLAAVLDPEQVRVAAVQCSAVLRRRNTARTRLPLELHRRAPFRELLAAADRLASELPEAQSRTVRECWIRGSLPGGRPQRVHRDRHVLGREVGAAPSISLDLLLTDFSEENGATELWPWSHRIPDRDESDASRAGERAALLPSTRIAAPAGSIVARDLRAWHRATPNRTANPRVMLSVVYAERSARSQPTS